MSHDFPTNNGGMFDDITREQQRLAREAHTSHDRQVGNDILLAAAHREYDLLMDDVRLLPDILNRYSIQPNRVLVEPAPQGPYRFRHPGEIDRAWLLDHKLAVGTDGQLYIGVSQNIHGSGPTNPSNIEGHARWVAEEAAGLMMGEKYLTTYDLQPAVNKIKSHEGYTLPTGTIGPLPVVHSMVIEPLDAREDSRYKDSQLWLSHWKSNDILFCSPLRYIISTSVAHLLESR